MRRWIARGAATALLVPAALGGAWLASSPALAADTAGAPAAGEQQVTGGELRWGVRSSIRNYLENFGHTAGWIAAYDGAKYDKAKGYTTFPAVSGTVNEADGTANIQFKGQMEMFGFDEDWLFFDRVRVEVSGGTAKVVADLLASYNVKTPTNNLTLASYTLGANALHVDANGKLSLTTGQGKFSKEVAETHLPSYGGPTDAAPNDWTDPITLEVQLGTGSENPGENPGNPGENPGNPGENPGNPGENPGNPGENPGTPSGGPYGVSAGKPYSNNTASVKVTPGYALNATKPTELLLEGQGFDPGPDVAPGTGEGGIYVGIGTMKDFTQPEKWRRSAGGSSGPQGMGDYTYGVPLFISNQGGKDAALANGVMDSSGKWSAKLTLPGSKFDSFFGDKLDCVATQCGVFTFGAHGAVKLANESFVPIFFTGQDESKWPSRDDDGTVTVPGTPEKPTVTPTFPAQSGLTDAVRGDTQVLSVTGRTLTVHAGKALAGTWVAAAVYSEPRFINWFLVPENGRITVPLPSDVADGSHRLALVNADSELVGWAPFELKTKEVDPRPETKPGKQDPNGSSTGRNQASGAELTVTPAKSLADRDQKVKVTGKGYPTKGPDGNFGGAYIFFGWVEKLPGAGGSSAQGDFVYAPGQETYQGMVSYPGNTSEPSAPMMDSAGNWSADFTIIGSKFTAQNGAVVDCYAVQCGVFTIGAHGKINAAAEVFTPVYFDENTDIAPGGRPVEPPKAPITANPNAAAAVNGAKVNGGVAALNAGPSDARTAFIAGALLLSFGLLGGALMRRERAR